MVYEVETIYYNIDSPTVDVYAHYTFHQILVHPTFGNIVREDEYPNLTFYGSFKMIITIKNLSLKHSFTNYEHNCVYSYLMIFKVLIYVLV